MEQNVISYCATHTSISNQRAGMVLTLIIKEECTVPFIARYRKEATGNLNEIQIRSVEKHYHEFQEREKRRNYILSVLHKEKVLTPELKAAVLQAQTLAQLEDIYTPYKSKRKTKAAIARENGLEPLALLILTSDKSIKALESSFNKTDKVKTFEDALHGAQDIIIEKIAHTPALKDHLRKCYKKGSLFASFMRKGAEEIKDHLKFKDYFDFEEPISNLFSPRTSHRFLAMSRGKALKILKLSININKDEILSLVEKRVIPASKNIGCIDVIKDCVQVAYKRYIHPSLESEFLIELNKVAEDAAIVVFGTNLRNLLLAPYLGSKTVLGIDPGIRTGCKVVVVDSTGKLLIDHVIYLQSSKDKLHKAKEELKQLITSLNVEHIAIGDGTFGRETLAFVEELISQVQSGKVKATLVSEAGASVYSASEAAIEEFPNKDVTVRGAVSIARRFQDPLGELVKIDPKAIGVGQYQHDVSELKIKESLEGVVEDCVNFVGVDLNTASYHLLSFISGIGATLSRNIIKFRDNNGRFNNRRELLKVGRFSGKVFQQAGGFLRIYDGDNPLDGTFVHPERYADIEQWCRQNSVKVDELLCQGDIKDKFARDLTLKKEMGEHTFNDIVHSLKAPSQDPRTAFKSTDFRKGLKNLQDVKVGEWYTGVVNNITNFGAFVNIGIKESGLVHISQLADQFVEDPLEVVKVGQEIKVKVLDIDLERKRLALSCKRDSHVENKPSSKPEIKRANTSKNKSQNVNSPFAALKGFKIK